MVIRNRNNHRGSITLGIAALSLLSLSSIGFATWVIAGGDEVTTEGSITVDTVENKIRKITVGEWTNKTSDNKGKIYFGYDKDVALTSTSAWLSSTSSEDELLSNSLTVTIANAYADEASTTLIEGATPTATLTILDGKESIYTDAVTKNVVGALPTPVVSEATKSGIDAKFTITVTFKWGSAFEGKNPATYAEAKAAENANYWNLTNKQTFSSNLEEVAKLNSIGFKLTIATN